MASPLVWKVYNDSGEMVAATMHAEDAAVVVSNFTKGRVRVDGRVVWHEGVESQPAGYSYDEAANVMHTRRREHNEERYAMMVAAQANYARRVQ
jgi:hypothetical protein